jgi:hypothetical protein
VAAGDRSAAPLLHSRRVTPAIPDVLCQSPCGAGAAAGPAHCCHTVGCQTQPVRHQRHRTGTNTVVLLAGVSVGAGERRSQNGRCGDPSSCPRIDPHIQPAALSDHQYSLDRRDKSQVGCAPGERSRTGEGPARADRAGAPCGLRLRGRAGGSSGRAGWELYVRYPSKLRGACGSRSQLSAPISRPFRSSVPVAGRFWFRWPPAGSRCLAISRFPVPGSRFPVPGSRFPVPGSRFPVPGSRFPVPGSRFPVPGSRNRFSWFRYPFWILFLAVLRWVTRSGLLVLPLLFAGWSWFRWPAGSRCLAVGWFQFRWPAGSGGRPIAVPVAGHHPAQRSATPGWAAPLSSSLPRTGSSAREMTGVLRPQRAGRVPHLREEMRR